jgi:hypothetical protein
MIDRLPGARQLRIWGALPLQDPGDTEVLGIDDPALYAAIALRDALVRRGIAIRGEAAGRALVSEPGGGLEERSGARTGAGCGNGAARFGARWLRICASPIK